jgi:hypothetical protein
MKLKVTSGAFGENMGCEKMDAAEVLGETFARGLSGSRIDRSLPRHLDPPPAILISSLRHCYYCFVSPRRTFYANL